MTPVQPTETPPSFLQLLRQPVHWFAFGLGSGLSPKAPGTAGTLASIPIFLLLQNLTWYWYLFGLIIAFGLGIYLCDKTARDLDSHDHPGIVWDEFVGYWLTMFLAPSGWLWIVVGFLLFRVFDIIKPWPISWCDRRVGGGLGIMLDDVIAGVFALVGLQLMAYLVPRELL